MKLVRGLQAANYYRLHSFGDYLISPTLVKSDYFLLHKAVQLPKWWKALVNKQRSLFHWQWLTLARLTASESSPISCCRRLYFCSGVSLMPEPSPSCSNKSKDQQRCYMLITKGNITLVGCMHMGLQLGTLLVILESLMMLPYCCCY